MTREDAFEIWLPIIKMGVKSMPECYEAIDMAIKALEQEPCTDTISRQAAIDACLNGWNKDYKEIVEDIRALPPITPAEKVGQWIPVSERLPEKNGQYLVTVKKGYMFLGLWCGIKDDWRNVIAWMPLPLPYKASPTGAERTDNK